MPQPIRDEDEFLAVCEALEEIAGALRLDLEKLPAFARLKGIMAEGHPRRVELNRQTWLSLAAVFSEASDESERMAGIG